MGPAASSRQVDVRLRMCARQNGKRARGFASVGVGRRASRWSFFDERPAHQESLQPKQPSEKSSPASKSQASKHPRISISRAIPSACRPPACAGRAPFLHFACPLLGCSGPSAISYCLNGRDGRPIEGMGWLCTAAFVVLAGTSSTKRR